MIVRAILLVACALALGGCGGGIEVGVGTSPGTTTRSYSLSATAVQAVANGAPFYQLTPGGASFAALANDVDVLTVVVEHYGIPWEEFANAVAPPDGHPWTIAMRNFAAAARASGKPLVLQVVLARDRLAARAGQSGANLVVDDNWKPACFDFGNPTDGARYRIAYRRFAVWIATLFEPADFVSGVEISAFRSLCTSDAAWTALVATANEAYDAVKAARPAMRVYPSFVLTDLYANSPSGLNATLVSALDGLRRDRLGLSVYPQGLAGLTRPSALPADFLRRLRDRRPSEPPIVITETGWNADDLRVGTPLACTTSLASNEGTAREYLDWLLNRANADGLTLVTWWSWRDLLPASVMAACYPNSAAPLFSECGGDAWCAALNLFRAASPGNPAAGEVLFKAFGTMGLRRYDGFAKSALFDRWQAARVLPIR